MADAYSTHLGSGATTLARCFRLARADGVVLGFTDHDAALSFGGVTYLPDTALSASAASRSLGLAPDEMEGSGALSSEAITAADLAAGRYDGATVEAWDVNWRDVSVRRLLGRYTIGQVERGRLAFRAELRSLAAGLDRKQGRVHSTLCDVIRLGDARCGLSLAPWQAAGTVATASGLTLTVATGSGLDARLMGRGILAWTTGANAGTESDVRAAAPSAAGWLVSLWQAPAGVIAPGDGVSLTAGCDRAYATCRDRFGNGVNFRGFPHMPGADIAGEYAVSGDPGLTGGSRFQ